MPTQVDVHGGVPFLDRRGNEHAITHDPGVVDYHMQIAERGHRGIDDPLGAVPIGDVLIIGDRPAASGLDFGHHAIGGAGIASLAAERGADVIDHHIRALGRKSQRIGAAQPARSAGDDDGAVVADTHYSLSIIVTLACPPPSHMV